MLSMKDTVPAACQPEAVNCSGGATYLQHDHLDDAHVQHAKQHHTENATHHYILALLCKPCDHDGVRSR